MGARLVVLPVIRRFDLFVFLKFDKPFRIVCQIQFLLFGNQPYAPLLHCQRAEKNLNGFSFFVISNFINNHRVGGYSSPFYFSLQ